MDRKHPKENCVWNGKLIVVVHISHVFTNGDTKIIKIWKSILKTCFLRDMMYTDIYTTAKPFIVFAYLLPSRRVFL
jgi:hypothetical protein